jgi:hypothetical protein
VNEKLSEKGLRRDVQNPDIYLVAHVSARTLQNVNYWPAKVGEDTAGDGDGVGVGAGAGAGGPA